jgi:hypothetical protein
MVQQGTIVQTPEQLDTWILEEAAVREVLERGGYRKAFTAQDLFPLLEVPIEQAGGPPRPAEPLSPTPSRVVRAAFVVGILLVVAAAAILVIL